METARRAHFEPNWKPQPRRPRRLQTPARTDRRRREGHRQGCPRASVSGHWNRVRRGRAYRRAGGAEPTRVRAGRHRSLGKPLVLPRKLTEPLRSRWATERQPCVASTTSDPRRAPVPVPQPVCVDACDRRARPGEMKKRWPNAALFVSLSHGWPEYRLPGIRCRVFLVFTRGSAASHLPRPRLPAGLRARVRVGSSVVDASPAPLVSNQAA